MLQVACWMLPGSNKPIACLSWCDRNYVRHRLQGEPDDRLRVRNKHFPWDNGCFMLSALRKREHCHCPREYVVQNRLSLAILFHSAVLNGICSSVLFFQASGQPVFQDITPFYIRWRRFIHHLSAVSYSIPMTLTLLSIACMLVMSGVPLRHVLPREEDVSFLPNNTVKLDITDLSLYGWVFQTPRSSMPSTGKGSVAYQRPRYTFYTGDAASDVKDDTPIPSTSGEPRRPRTTSHDLLTRITDVLEGSPFNYSTSTDEGTIIDKAATSPANGDFDDDFDEEDDSKFPDETLPSESATAVTSAASSDGQLPRSLDLLVALDMDSLVNLSHLELMARQCRTSATLRRIWKTSERRTSPQ
ncbi:uncharacterized protein LOC135368206 isoform X2 [Ornithodoros turicata]|uniref:uncharacterized protein LOC135368206 isoform X2 n=1 Tax=Ornithodoros turicata TaxID=34597 RepID=UPI003139EDC6